MVAMMADVKRFNLGIDAKVGEAVSALAEFERRSINSMVEALLVEALAARGVIERPEPPKFDL